MTEDEEFFAWLDGELDGDAAARVEARVIADPELSAKAAAHRRVAKGLRKAFQTVSESPAPAPRFASADVIDFGARATDRSGRERLRQWFAAPQWATMAATLVVGLVAGTTIDRGGTDFTVVVEGGRLVAAASLDQALDTRLASAPAADGARIGLTFRDASGRVCRSFTGGPGSGLACREAGEWRIRGLFQGDERQASEYRMAAGEDPRLAALIDEMIAGEPFDAAQEKAAQDKGWR